MTYLQHPVGTVIPRMSADQYTDLRTDIERNGLIQPIILYEDQVLDGWHRYNICVSSSVAPHFDTYQGDSPVTYVLSCNAHRRHLTPSQKAAVAVEILPMLEAEARKRQITSTGGVTPQLVEIFPQADKGKARDKAGELFRVNNRYVQDAKKLKSENPELFEQVKAGTLELAEVQRERKLIARKQEIENIKNQIAVDNLTISGKFDVLVIDPPWQYKEKGLRGEAEYDPEFRGVTPYPTMTLEAIGNIQLPIKEDAVVFLWTTQAFLRDAFDLLDGWGLTYKATMVWDKERMGLGMTIRLQCEFCLVATLGKPLLQGQAVRDIIREQGRQHSRKPEAFYQAVEKMTVGRRLDYFAREQRKGWQVYGVESDKF